MQTECNLRYTTPLCTVDVIYVGEQHDDGAHLITLLIPYRRLPLFDLDRRQRATLIRLDQPWVVWGYPVPAKLFGYEDAGLYLDLFLADYTARLFPHGARWEGGTWVAYAAPALD